MSEARVIADTSALVYLHRIGQLHLLKEYYREILVPSAVAAELEQGKSKGAVVPSLDNYTWIEVKEVQYSKVIPLVTDLGPGELEVILLGIEIKDSLVILDDLMARRVARMMDLKVIGILGIILKAKREGRIDSMSQALESLQQQGMWISEALARQLIKAAGE